MPRAGALAFSGTLSIAGAALGFGGRRAAGTLVGVTSFFSDTALLRGTAIAFLGVASGAFLGVTACTIFGGATVALFGGLALGSGTLGPFVGLAPRALLRRAPFALLGLELRQFLRRLSGAARMLVGLRLLLPCLLLRGTAGTIIGRALRTFFQLAPQAFLR